MKATIVEVQVVVVVKPEEDPTEVLTRVATAAQAMKKELGETQTFNVLTRDVPVRESNKS